MTQRTDSPDILYVGGYGRSGSTILDILLDDAPSRLGAGELTFLFNDLMEREECSCRRPLGSCPVWGEVFDRIRSRLAGFDVERADSVTERVESRPRGPVEEYGSIWRTTLEALFEETEAGTVVDSSKTSRRNWRRPLLLSRECGFDVKMIHLTRDPRGVMWSVEKGSNRALEGRGDIRLWGGPFRAIASWSLSNVMVEASKKAISNIDVTHVRYEDLVTDPAGTLREIGRFAGLDVEETVKTLDSDGPLGTGHGVAGNRLRRQNKAIRIQADQEWRDELATLGRVLARLPAPLNWLYDYPSAKELNPSD